MPRKKTNGSGKYYQGLLEYNKIKMFPNEQVFVENSTYQRTKIKARIIKQKLKPYMCEECKAEPMWNGKTLVFVLDHINGIHNDHRLENLRFLCPNCNSQTETFSGRNKAYKKKMGSGAIGSADDSES